MDCLRLIVFLGLVYVSKINSDEEADGFFLDDAKANIPFFRNLFERIKEAKEERERKVAAGETRPRQIFAGRSHRISKNVDSDDIQPVPAQPVAESRQFFSTEGENTEEAPIADQREAPESTSEDTTTQARRPTAFIRLQPVDPGKPSMSATLSKKISSLNSDAVNEIVEKAKAINSLRTKQNRPRKKHKKATRTTTTTTEATTEVEDEDDTDFSTTDAAAPQVAPRRSAGSLASSENLGEKITVVVGKQANALEHLTRTLVDKFGITSDQIKNVLPLIPVSQTIKQDCLTEAEGSPKVSLTDPFAGNLPKCAQTKYRSFDGTCNNIAFPNRGSTTSIFIRMIEPDYSDSIGAPRKAKSGQLLPSARLISKQVAGNLDVPSTTTTVLFMQFGQFIDHDVTNTPKSRGVDKLPPTCCFDNEPNKKLDPACYPIPIPADDVFFAPLKQKCMDFVRSLPGTRPGCTLGAREQVNQNTAFLDGSAIYGGTMDKADGLRSHVAGQMLTFAPKSDPHYNLLPQNTKNAECIDPTEIKMCFRAGDVRANVHLGITEIQTLWLRQHNLVAAKLKEQNPKWDDDKLFNEARHIVVAQLQHIAYNEFLPVFLGDMVMEKWKLRTLEKGRSHDYDIAVHPGILNEFATAAYRVGHTMVPPEFRRASGDYKFRGSEKLKTTFFHPFAMYDKDAFDEVLLGMVSSPAQEVDINFVDDLSNHLFEIPGDAFGLDLTALNIQRGRDHGIAGWMKWRKLCGLPTAASFAELKDMNIVSNEIVDKMTNAYEDIADVDLYLAGAAEIHVPGGKLGPTFACIIADQFRRLKYGDRFWYENDLPLSSSMSDRQVQAIRGITMAKVACDNTPMMEAVQSKAFLLPDSRSNPVVSCDTIPEFDYTPWKVRPA